MKITSALALGLLLMADSARGAEPAAPPAGWKEAEAKDSSFTVWIPEKTIRQTEREKTIPCSIKGFRVAQQLHVTVLDVDVTSDLSYFVESVTLPPILRFPRKEIEEFLRDIWVQDLRGKVLKETDTKLGDMPGKEYLIQTGNGLAQLRLFVGEARHVYILHAEGSKAQIEKDATQTFFSSFRLPSGSKTGSVAELFSAKRIVRVPYESFSGHTGPVSSVAVSPDGMRAMSGGGWPLAKIPYPPWALNKEDADRPFTPDSLNAPSTALVPKKSNRGADFA